MFINEEYFKRRKEVWDFTEAGRQEVVYDSCESHEEEWRWSSLSCEKGLRGLSKSRMVFGG